MQEGLLKKITEGIWKDYNTVAQNGPEKSIDSLIMRYGSLPWLIKVLLTKLPESHINKMIEHVQNEQLVENYSLAYKYEKWQTLPPWHSERIIFEKFINRANELHECENCQHPTHIFDKIIGSFSCSYSCSWEIAYKKKLDYDMSVVYIAQIELADNFPYSQKMHHHETPSVIMIKKAG